MWPGKHDFQDLTPSVLSHLPMLWISWNKTNFSGANCLSGFRMSRRGWCFQIPSLPMRAFLGERHVRMDCKIYDGNWRSKGAYMITAMLKWKETPTLASYSFHSIWCFRELQQNKQKRWADPTAMEPQTMFSEKTGNPSGRPAWVAGQPKKQIGDREICLMNPHPGYVYIYIDIYIYMYMRVCQTITSASAIALRCLGVPRREVHHQHRDVVRRLLPCLLQPTVVGLLWRGGKSWRKPWEMMCLWGRLPATYKEYTHPVGKKTVVKCMQI